MDDRSWRIACAGERRFASRLGSGARRRSAKMVDHLQSSGVKLDLGTGDARAACSTSPRSTTRSATARDLLRADRRRGDVRAAARWLRFVTDGVGLGHVLYVVPSCTEALDFFTRMMGLKVTDQFAGAPTAQCSCTPRRATTASPTSTSRSRRPASTTS
jgi:hypothetical protein